MKAALVEAVQADAERLRGMLDEYLHELAPHDDAAVGAWAPGEYPYLDAYFLEVGRYPFFVGYGGDVAGFALVRGPRSTGKAWQMAEFYVVPECRRSGVGRAAVLQIWRRFAGDWEIQVHSRNSAAIEFWLACVTSATGSAPATAHVNATDGRRIQLNFRIEANEN